jgi:pectate lyase
MLFVRVPRIRARSRHLMSSASLLAATLALGAATAHALPVIPGAAGYGMDTPAGRGGTVYRVTYLNADGSGSLKACIDRTGPRVCIFEVSGTIRITSDLIVRNGRLTIAGQTAPSPGITIRGAALRINQTSDVLVQHIRVRAGDDANGPDPENRDSLKIEGSTTTPVRNVVIDHCTFSWAIDEIASVWGPHDNITFTNNIFSEPLHESIHPQADGSGYVRHGFGVLIGSSASGGKVTMVGNLFAHIAERNPLSRARALVFVNNLVYDRMTRDVDLQSESGRVTNSSLKGNVILRGPAYVTDSRPIYIRTSGSGSLVSGSRVYVNDTYTPDWGTTLTQQVVLTGGDTISNLLQTSTAPVWNTGLTARSTANNAVYNRVLAYSGARPFDRDNTDKRIVASVKNRTGRIINCVSANGTTRCDKNAGGWPTLAQNRRALTLPSNPNSTASNGYTNLENWLHALDQQLQGVTSTLSPTSPPTLSAQ